MVHHSKVSRRQRRKTLPCWAFKVPRSCRTTCGVRGVSCLPLRRILASAWSKRRLVARQSLLLARAEYWNPSAIFLRKNQLGCSSRNKLQRPSSMQFAFSKSKTNGSMQGRAEEMRKDSRVSVSAVSFGGSVNGQWRGRGPKLKTQLIAIRFQRLPHRFQGCDIFPPAELVTRCFNKPQCPTIAMN